MAIALYDPPTGYYARAGSPFGAAGDYLTSPHLHPAFAVLLSRQVEELWRALGRPEPYVVQESGPGGGLFARDLLDWLRDEEPRLYAALEYRLDERSAARQLEQQGRLAHAGHLERVRWVDGFRADEPVHLVLANELLDALPVHLVRLEGQRLRELYVTVEAGRLTLAPGEPSSARIEAYFDRLGLVPGEGCQAEVNLAALDWLTAAAAALPRGLMLVLDYGYPAEQLYAPARRQGTLLCYYRHTLSSDPLARIGEQDLTSHVDFSSLRLAGEAAGLRTLGLISQRRLLANLGLEMLADRVEQETLPQAERDANRRALEALVDPSGLGRILALFQARGLDGYAPLGLVGTAGTWRPGRPVLRGPEHTRLPGPEELEGLGDFEALWSEIFDEPQAQ